MRGDRGQTKIAKKLHENERIWRGIGSWQRGGGQPAGSVCRGTRKFGGIPPIPPPLVGKTLMSVLDRHLELSELPPNDSNSQIYQEYAMPDVIIWWGLH